MKIREIKLKSVIVRCFSYKSAYKIHTLDACIAGLYQAGVAQLAEQLICNQQVGGSSPLASSIFRIAAGVAQW